jgi:hypothetical protein
MNRLHSPQTLQNWAAFAAEPVRYMHRDRVLACFAGAIAPGLVSEMQLVPRLQADLVDLVGSHYGLSALANDPGVDGSDLYLASMPREETAAFFQTCGAILWANAIAAEIRAPVIAAIKARIGARAFSKALENRDLAVNCARPPDIDALMANMERDGAACFALWLTGLPVSLKGWVELKFQPSDLEVPAPSGEMADRARRVIERLAELLASGEQR